MSCALYYIKVSYTFFKMVYFSEVVIVSSYNMAITLNLNLKKSKKGEFEENF